MTAKQNFTIDDLTKRIIEPRDFVADAAAFVDVRLPNSEGKLSYSFIGPGVSQNPDQTVNITEPHGFNIGAAALAPGLINNPHLHFTAEVFICKSGHWRFDVGPNGEQSLEVNPGDVFSVPTWVFRGFENIGDDDGFVYTILGGDTTGGILWAPTVLRRAAETGLFLSPNGTVIEADPSNPPANVLTPLSDEDLKTTSTVTDDELTARLVTPDSLRWSDRALLSSVIDGHRCEVAPVIGYGITQDRSQQAPIMYRHGFSADWLRLSPGSSTGWHRTETAQVLIVAGSGLEVSVGADDSVSQNPSDGAIVSIPADTWRNYANTSDEELRLMVVNSGDQAPGVQWSAEIIDSARQAGWAIDANGFIAAASLIAPGPRKPS